MELGLTIVFTTVCALEAGNNMSQWNTLEADEVFFRILYLASYG